MWNNAVDNQKSKVVIEPQEKLFLTPPFVKVVPY